MSDSPHNIIREVKLLGGNTTQTSGNIAISTVFKVRLKYTLTPLQLIDKRLSLNIYVCMVTMFILTNTYKIVYGLN